MRRYTITLGAASTAGGKVISASSASCIDGMPIALEGDLVTCPVCQTAGKILCVGPRIPESWNGRNVALENDLCICRCVTASKLLPNQNLRCQVIKDSGRALSQPFDVVVARGAATHVFNDRYVLLDEVGGRPLARHEYALVRSTGKLEFGTSDEHGCTHLLSATAQAECVDIYAQGAIVAPALISPSGQVLHRRARRCTTPAAETLAKEVHLRATLELPQAAPDVADVYRVFQSALS